MRMTSTGAFPRALAAARPPKPPPTITTRGAFDFRSSAPLIELKLASFMHLFLKLSKSEISENLGFSRRRLDRGRISLLDGQPRSLSEPETDQQNQDKRGHADPGNHNDLESDLTNGRNIVVNVRIAVKEPVTVAKDISAEQQIDDEEKCRGDSQSRKSYGINQCEHIMYRRDHFPFGSHSGLLDPRGTRTVR